MSNKFSSALKGTGRATGQAPAKASSETTEQTAHKRTGARAGTKHIGGYFDPAVARQLKSLAVEEDSSVQALLAEALDRLFQARGRPTIASRKS